MKTSEPKSFVRLDRYDLILLVFVFTAAMVLYGRTVTPGLLPGDGGEFQTLAYLYGHTHPTGYPVYLTLVRLFTFLPLGDLAYRVNLFSAVMAALAVTGVYFLGRLLTSYRAVPLAAAVALAISPTFWSQAIIAEIYSTGAVFIILILISLFWWDRTGSRRALLLAGLLGGLSLGVHMSVALLAPAVLIFLLIHRKRGLPVWKTAATSAAAGVLVTIGLFWIIDLNNPTASYFNSVVEPSRTAWGLTKNEIDGPIDRLKFGWQARQFQFLMFTDITEVMPSQGATYFDNLTKEFTRLTILVALVGIVAGFWRRARFTALTVIALGTQCAFFFNYEIWDLYVFYIPSYILLVVLAIEGLGALAEVMEKGLNNIDYTARLIPELVLTVLLLIFMVWPVFEPLQSDFNSGKIPFDFDEYPEYDEFTHQVAFATVINLPDNAIVFTEWDNMWPYYYVAHLEEDRSDLAFIEAFPADDQDNLADSMLVFIDSYKNEHPMYFDRRLTQLERIDGLTMGPARVGPTRLFKLIIDS